MRFQTLMPMFVRSLANEDTVRGFFGFSAPRLASARWVARSILLATEQVVGLGRIMALAGLLLGVSIAWFANAHMLWLALLLAAVSGLGSIISFAAGNTMLQAIVDDHMRGRLMAFYIMAVMGTAPLGSIDRAGGSRRPIVSANQ